MKPKKTFSDFVYSARKKETARKKNQAGIWFKEKGIIIMKKTFTRVLTLVLTATLFAGALAACGAKEDNKPTTTTTPEATPSTAPENNNQNTENNNQNTENNNQGTENNDQNQGETTVGQTCINVYKEQIAAGASIEDALNAVAEKIELMGMVEKDFEWVQGFDTTITGYTHIYGLMPMFGGFPFIMYSFETDDVDALKAMLDEHADLRWNICTAAEEKFIEVVDGKVVFVMARKTFDEE